MRDQNRLYNHAGRDGIGIAVSMSFTSSFGGDESVSTTGDYACTSPSTIPSIRNGGSFTQPVLTANGHKDDGHHSLQIAYSAPPEHERHHQHVDTSHHQGHEQGYTHHAHQQYEHHAQTDSHSLNRYHGQTHHSAHSIFRGQSLEPEPFAPSTNQNHNNQEETSLDLPSNMFAMSPGTATAGLERPHAHEENEAMSEVMIPDLRPKNQIGL